MAVTSSPRIGVTRWSAGSDPFTRLQMEASHAALDNLTAIDVQGPEAARPALAARGTYYYSTDAHQLARNDGTEWVAVGASDAGLPLMLMGA